MFDEITKTVLLFVLHRGKRHKKLHFTILNTGLDFVLQYQHRPLDVVTGICASNLLGGCSLVHVCRIRFRFWIGNWIGLPFLFDRF